MFLINTAMEKIPIGTAALIVVLGMAVVFFGLILLMFVTKIAGAIIGRKKAAAPAAAPAAASAAPAVPNAPAPGSAGKIALHDVPDKTAAMLMAIVADRTGKPLNQLRFISIREVKD
ncbi:MAG: OadG family protein [Oscillospiraceae bacterium]